MSRLWPGRPIEEVDSSDSEAETVNRVSPTAVQKSPESHKPSSHKPESHKSGVSTKQPDRHSDTQRDDRSVQRADTHQDTHRDKQVESDDSDDERLRRERIRQRRSLMEQEDAPTRRNPILEPKPDTSPTHQPTAPAATEAQQKGLSSEEETESTDSSSEDEYPKRVLIRPVFVKKYSDSHQKRKRDDCRETKAIGTGGASQKDTRDQIAREEAGNV
ncbi:hypothetical protein EDD86DRAFT_219859 [Gorgonomyces haynaldii]|nr:hypothetical protein EDD86DRAFT_219859 [Gorgonomyces haynaldii]